MGTGVAPTAAFSGCAAPRAPHAHARLANQAIDPTGPPPPWLVAAPLDGPTRDVPTVPDHAEPQPAGGRFLRVTTRPLHDGCVTKLAVEDDSGWWSTPWSLSCDLGGVELEDVSVAGDALVVRLAASESEALAWTIHMIVVCGAGPSRVPSCTPPVVIAYHETQEADRPPHSPEIVLSHWSIAVDVRPRQLVVPDHDAPKQVEGLTVARAGRWPIGFP